MSQFKGLSVIILIIIVTGCASYKVPISPITAPYKNINVGLLVDVSDTPKHSHIGTTIFNNFNKEYPFKWNIKQEIYTIFENKIKTQTDLEVVDLSFMRKDFDHGNNDLVVVENDTWTLNNDSESLRKELLAKDIKVVIIIREGRTLADLECSNYGCSERYSEGHGVYSRSFLGFKTYFASASYLISVESLDPVVDISLLPKLREALFYDQKNKVIKDFKPNELKDLTASELLVVKGHILEYLERIADLTTSYLNGYIDVTTP